MGWYALNTPTHLLARHDHSSLPCQPKQRRQARWRTQERVFHIEGDTEIRVAGGSGMRRLVGAIILSTGCFLQAFCSEAAAPPSGGRPRASATASAESTSAGNGEVLS